MKEQYNRNAARWEAKMRLQLIMEKLAPFAIVALTALAFLTIGYLEVE